MDLHLPTRKGYIVRISRKTGAMTGFVLIVLGLWGGLVPLIGPYFGYAFGSHATWDLTMNRFGLDVLPGAAVVAKSVEAPVAQSLSAFDPVPLTQNPVTGVGSYDRAGWLVAHQ